jgi:predicted HTH transcriptional regulator
MTPRALQSQIALGEDSKRQFKVDVRNAESLAAEMAAFANSEGGTILIGVADGGATPGLVTADVSRINQLISNAASQLVRSPLAVQTENVPLGEGRVVIVLTVPKGIDKPYFDKNGVIWLKTGADKRRVNSKEELRRLFQFSDQFHADELPTKAGIDKLHKLRFRDFLRDIYKREFPDTEEERLRRTAGQRFGSPRLSGQRADPAVCLRQPHRNHQPRPPAQQPDRGENPHRKLQHSEPNPGLLRRQGLATLPRTRIGHQKSLGAVAAN